jgi:hypothetical protein
MLMIEVVDGTTDMEDWQIGESAGVIARVKTSLIFAWRVALPSRPRSRTIISPCPWR